MSSTTTNLTNINFMSESKYDSLTEIHDDELYAVKIDGLDGEQLINQNPNENPVKVWTGTRAEYNAIETKNPDTIYHITDDDNITQSLLETLYPVGAIYIGTMNICPLSALFGTWEKVSSGRVLQGADDNHNPGTTIEAGLPDVSHKHIDGFAGVNSTASYGVTTTTSVGNINTQNGTSTSYHAYTSTSSLSEGNPIYGNSNTVQPPAFVVNIWKRTA